MTDDEQWILRLRDYISRSIHIVVIVYIIIIEVKPILYNIIFPQYSTSPSSISLM